MALFPSLLSSFFVLHFFNTLLLSFDFFLYLLFLFFYLTFEGFLIKNFKRYVFEVFGSEVGPFMFRHVPVDDSIDPIIFFLMII